MASINSFVNIANQMLQINSSVTQTNNIVIKFEKNINKTKNSLTALGNTRAIEKLNSSLENTNRAIQKLGMGSSKLTKDNSNRLTNINILLGWAKNLINFADSTGKINSAMSTLSTTISSYLIPVVTAFSNGILFIAANMQLFLPLLWVLIAALGVYYSAQIQAAVATALACAPLMILLKTVLLIVGALYLVVNIVNRVTGSSVSALGVIVGAFYAFGQAVENIVLFCWNHIAAFANFLANVFVNPIAAIKVLFYDLRSNVLDILLSLMQGIETAINKIPGVQLDLTSNLRAQLETVRLAASKAKTEAQLVEVMQTKAMGSLTEAYSKGYNIGAAGFKSGSVFSANNTLDSINNSTAMVAANTAQMKDSLDVSSEDLSYLRDLAEMEAINRFTTAEIKVDMINNNRIDSDRDIDSVMDQFALRLMGALNTVKEGV